MFCEYDVADFQTVTVKGLVHSFIKKKKKKQGKKKDKLLIYHKWSIKSPQHCHSTEVFYFHYVIVFATVMHCRKVWL